MEVYTGGMAKSMSPTAIASLAAACASQPIVLAYLFGSHARDAADDESDIDIAILAEASLSKEERHRLRLKLMRDFADALGLPVEKMDVVVLQDVAILLQYNVIRQGRPFAVQDRSTKIEYELGVERRYDDEAPFLTQEADLTFQRILSHRR